MGWSCIIHKYTHTHTHTPVLCNKGNTLYGNTNERRRRKSLLIRHNLETEKYSTIINNYINCCYKWYLNRPVTDYNASDRWQQLHELFLIVVFPCILISTKLFCQQMHCLLKHKMLQFVLRISLYRAPTCFGPSWTIIREHTWSLAKVTVSLKSSVKTHS